MRKALAVALCIASSPSIASPPKSPSCISLEKMQAKMGEHTTASPVTKAQYHFLQGVTAVLPNTPPGLPPGDSAILVTKDHEDNGYVIWVSGALACGAMLAPPPLLKLLAQLKGTEKTEDDL